MLFLGMKTCAALLGAAMVTLFCARGACDAPEQGTGRIIEQRCELQGLCWQPVGKRSIEGAFRRGDKEIKFDVIFSPTLSFETQFQDEWSMRVLDWEGNTFIIAESSNPPATWRARERDPEIFARRMYASIETVHERLRMATALTEAASHEKMAAKHLRDPWSRFVDLLHMAEQMSPPMASLRSAVQHQSIRKAGLPPIMLANHWPHPMVHGLALEPAAVFVDEDDAEQRVSSWTYERRNHWSSIWVGY